jgi:hypothetical protein
VALQAEFRINPLHMVKSVLEMSEGVDMADREVILKQLDHIQAIVGRFDTFFFLMKQLCATAVFASIWEYIKRTPQQRPPIMIWEYVPLLVGIPLFFCITEYLFRFFHWSGYILRLDEIREDIRPDAYSVKVDNEWCWRIVRSRMREVTNRHRIFINGPSLSPSTGW